MAIRRDEGAKTQITKLLREQGYPRYAIFLSYFDIFLTDDPETIGYMIPGKAVIVLNEELNIYQVSVVVRHEILHEFFTHGPRATEFERTHPDLGSDHELSNIAADFEISNRGYTLDDKANIRTIKLNNKTLRGLVTEDHYEEWKGLTFEEMYENLLKERKNNQEALKELLDQLSKVSKQNLDELEDTLRRMSDAASDAEDGQSSSSKPTGGKGGTPPSRGTSSTAGDDESSDNPVAGTTGEDEGDTISELQDEVAEIKNNLNKKGGGKEEGFPHPQDQRSEAEVAARVEQIWAELRNMNAFDEIMSETNTVIRKERVAQARVNQVSNYAKGGNGGLSDFKLDLQRFISSQISYQRERTWERPDPRYKRRGFLVQGSANKREENIPVINVYWDTSGSFSNPAKTAAARAAIDSIQQYVKKGLIDIKVYYHSDKVYDHPVSGGNNGDAVVEHIRATHPDNIIIITDGDLSDTRKCVKVPGAAWFLFYDYTSRGLIDNVSGRKQTKWYMVKY